MSPERDGIPPSDAARATCTKTDVAPEPARGFAIAALIPVHVAGIAIR